MRAPLLLTLVLLGCASTTEATKESPPATAQETAAKPGAAQTAATQPGASQTSATQPSTQPAPRPGQPAAVQPQKGEAAHADVLTAADAAAAYSREHSSSQGGGGDSQPLKQAAQPPAPQGDEDGPCATDADCAYTRVAAGQCCPMLCTPRVVTKVRAKALNDQVATCNGGRECPEPMCRPPREATRPACVQNRCVAQPVPGASDR